jgi:hypothetical protein
MMVALTSTAAAAALDKKLLPAGTQWVVHVDMDMFNNTTLKKALMDEHDTFRFRKGSGKFFKDTHIDLWKDVSSITAFGNKKERRDLVFCLKGNLDRDFLLSQLKSEHKLREVKYNNYTLYQWGHSQFGVFAAKNLTLYSRDEDSIKAVLDLLKGKGKSIKGDNLSRYLNMIPGNAFVLAAAGNISDMAKHGYPGAILKNAGMASFMAMENNKDFTMKVLLNTESEETARNIENVIKGLMAVANMSRGAGHDHRGNEEEKVLLQLIDKVQLSSSGKTVKLSFTYPSLALVELMRKHREHKEHKEYKEHKEHKERKVHKEHKR